MNYLILTSIIIIFSSCISSSDVVHKGLLQKRKYKKGYNISRKKKNDPKLKKSNNKEALLSNNINKSHKIVHFIEKKENILITNNDTTSIRKATPLKTSILKAEENNLPQKIIQKEDKQNTNRERERKKIYRTHIALVISLLFCSVGIGIPFLILIYLYARINILRYSKKWGEENEKIKKQAKKLKGFSIASNLILLPASFWAYINYPFSSYSSKQLDNLLLLGLLLLLAFIICFFSALSNYLNLYKSLEITPKKSIKD